MAELPDAETLVAQLERAVGAYIRATEREGGMRDEPELLQGARNRLFALIDALVDALEDSTAQLHLLADVYPENSTARLALEMRIAKDNALLSRVRPRGGENAAG